MENADVGTPTRTPHSRSRSVLGGISLSRSRLNVPSSPVPSGKNQATSTAANRLIVFNRRTPQNATHRRSLSATSGPQYRRQSSKAARYGFLQRVASVESELSGDSDSVTTSDSRLNLGDVENPIINFRPQLWRHLERTRDTINLDLFWPQRLDDLEDQEEDEDEDQYDKNMFPLQGLLPLCEFRNLRSLRLGGMLQSYQTHIWWTCWLNPGLEELVLEMALEPTIIDLKRRWTPIDGPWRRKTISEACIDYLGEQEDGSLCDSTGSGEYLDKNAMACARSLVSSQGVNLRYLPIVKLVLAGFVVDAGPFFRWFNPMRLRQIEFKYGCIDAGFALPSHMSKLVTVSWPGKPQQEDQTITVSRIRQHEVKSIWVKRKASRASHASGLKPRISSILTKNWFSSTRAHPLRARKADKEHQPHSSQASQTSSSSDLSLFRHRSSSGICWTSKDFVDV